MLDGLVGKQFDVRQPPEQPRISSTGFQESAESQITAALGAQIAPAAEAILRELETLRVAFDVRYDAVTQAVAALRTASPAWFHEVVQRLARAAGEKAEAAARIARGQAAEQAQACLAFERARADERLQSVQAETMVQREAGLREQTALRGALEEARAQVDVLHTHTRTQLEAAMAAQTQLLETARAQTSAAREEGERAATAYSQLVDGLRAQLEQAQADLQRARADTARVEHMAPAQPEAVPAQFLDAMGPEAQIHATPTEVREAVRPQLDQPAGPPPGEIQPDRNPRTDPSSVRQAAYGASEDDPFAAPFSGLDRAATLTEALDALLDGVGAANGRAALFLVKSEKLQGWRSIGFEREATITSTFELPLAGDSTLTRAATTGQTIVSGNGPAPDASPSGAAHEPWTVTLPVMLGDRVIAVVYADEGAQLGNGRPPLDRAAAFDVSERLARHASRRLAAITATDREGDSDFTPEAPAAPEVPAASPEQTRPAEPAHINGAQRYAGLLASEMTRHGEADASPGSSDENLSTHFKNQIERCERQSATPGSPEARSTEHVLDEAIFEMFGRIDIDTLRPLETAGEALVSGAGIDRPALAAASQGVGA